MRLRVWGLGVHKGVEGSVITGFKGPKDTLISY